MNRLNKRMLEAAMKLHGDTGIDLAAYLEMQRGTFSRKINEKDGAGFTQSEIAKIVNRYKLSAEEIRDIFFAECVS